MRRRNEHAVLAIPTESDGIWLEGVKVEDLADFMNAFDSPYKFGSVGDQRYMRILAAFRKAAEL